MHSKAHFKSLFKSPENSTVEPKNIFFVKTTFPKEHNHIYFTIFGATKLNIQNYKTTPDLYLNELALKQGVADTRDPLVS